MGTVIDAIITAGAVTQTVTITGTVQVIQPNTSVAWCRFKPLVLFCNAYCNIEA